MSEPTFAFGKCTVVHRTDPDSGKQTPVIVEADEWIQISDQMVTAARTSTTRYMRVVESDLLRIEVPNRIVIYQLVYYDNQLWDAKKVRDSNG
jgi:hypothetical protein